jgi:hypothetical protein
MERKNDAMVKYGNMTRNMRGSSRALVEMLRAAVRMCDVES